MRLRAVAALVISLSASACRTDSNGNDLASAGPSPRDPVMVVAMGGFNSCTSASNGLTPANTDVDKHRNNIYGLFSFANERPTWVRSCYDKSGTIYYQWAHMTDEISTFTPQRTNFNELAPFVDIVAKEAARFPNRPIFLVGHSHGGWLALKLALALPDSIKFAGIVTVDPISRVNCGITSIIWQNHNGCQEPPQDISDEERGTILRRLVEGGQWRHYYQRNFYPLRSDAYGGSNMPHIQRDLSPFLSYIGNGNNAALNAHTEIDNLESPWLHIRERMASAAGAAPGLGLTGSSAGDETPRVARTVALQYLTGLGFTCGSGVPVAQGYTLACQGEYTIEPFDRATWRVSLKFGADDILQRHLIELVP